MEYSRYATIVPVRVSKSAVMRHRIKRAVLGGALKAVYAGAGKDFLFIVSSKLELIDKIHGLEYIKKETEALLDELNTTQ